MKITILTVTILLVFSACGMLGSKNANNSNSKAANSASPSPSSTPTEIDKGKSLPPTTMSVGEFMTSYDADNEGRTVTVDGGELDSISYSYLLIRDGSGYGFNCNGSFSEYMDMQSRIDDLRYKKRSPSVTVKGTYTRGSNGKPDLSSCILIDIKK